MGEHRGFEAAAPVKKAGDDAEYQVSGDDVFCQGLVGGCAKQTK